LNPKIRWKKFICVLRAGLGPIYTGKPRRRVTDWDNAIGFVALDQEREDTNRMPRCDPGKRKPARTRAFLIM